MTAEKLLSLRSIRREITRTKRRMADMARQLKDAQGDFALLGAISAERALLDNYLLRLKREESELVEFVNSIEDALLREIFMLRYFDGVKTWQRIAFLTGEHDESYVRRKHNTYLKKN